MQGGEFGFIARHFAGLAGPEGLGLLDDAALCSVPDGMELAVSVDTMVEAVHFFPDDPPDLIARKLLRCNLSDLAAMGAWPHGYFLAVAKPDHLDDTWFAAFARGLAEDQSAFGVRLLGGDTTRSTGPLVLTLTIMGHVPSGCALRRKSAQPGDLVFVTGTIGDAALGLQARMGKLDDTGKALTERYLLPQPRVSFGIAARGIARACMDVSDGLVQDAGHIAKASGVRLIIDAARVPLSDAARMAGPRWLATCLTGGDDYELLLTCPPGRAADMLALGNVTAIGHVEEGAGVSVLAPDGQEMALSSQGWQHF